MIKNNGFVGQVRDAGGRFKRAIPGIVIVSMMLMIMVLGIMNYINFREIQSLEARITSVHTATLASLQKGNQRVLDATLGEIARIELDRKENTADMLNLVEGSTDLTDILKNQVLNTRKLNALQ